MAGVNEYASVLVVADATYAWMGADAFDTGDRPGIINTVSTETNMTIYCTRKHIENTLKQKIEFKIRSMPKSN